MFVRTPYGLLLCRIVCLKTTDDGAMRCIKVSVSHPLPQAALYRTSSRMKPVQLLPFLLVGLLAFVGKVCHPHTFIHSSKSGCTHLCVDAG